MTDKEKAIFGLIKLAILGGIFVAFAAFNTNNGWDWKTDIAPLITILLASGGMDLVKPKT